MTVAREVGSERVAMIGPAEVTVGELVTFETDLRDVDQWLWIMPDGALEPDAPRVQLRTRSAGIARITLLGITPRGRPHRDRPRLRVQEK